MHMKSYTTIFLKNNDTYESHSTIPKKQFILRLILELILPYSREAVHMRAFITLFVRNISYEIIYFPVSAMESVVQMRYHTSVFLGNS